MTLPALPGFALSRRHVLRASAATAALLPLAAWRGTAAQSATPAAASIPRRRPRHLADLAPALARRTAADQPRDTQPG